MTLKPLWGVTCYLSGVTCQVSHVRCQVIKYTSPCKLGLVYLSINSGVLEPAFSGKLHLKYSKLIFWNTLLYTFFVKVWRQISVNFINLCSNKYPSNIWGSPKLVLLIPLNCEFIQFLLDHNRSRNAVFSTWLLWRRPWNPINSWSN